MVHKACRIGFFIETDSPGGAEKVLMDLALYARDKGYSPVLIDFGSCWLKEQADTHSLEYLQVEGFQEYKSINTLFYFCFKFSKFLKNHNIDMLHSHLFGPVTAAALAAFFARIPSVGTLHDVYMLDEHWLRIRQVQLAAVLGTRLVCVSRHMENYYRKKGYFSRKALTTIYNGIDLLWAKDKAQKKGGRVRVCCVGRLVPLKQVSKIIEAASRLLEAEYDIELNIIGEGSERDNLERQISTTGLNEHIKLWGARDDVADILAEQDIFVQFSTTEGLSLSVLEAASAGLAVVVSDVGGNSEIVGSGMGFLIPAGDTNALFDSLKKLVSNEQLRVSLGTRLQQNLRLKFERVICNDQYIGLYKSLVG